MGHDIRRITIMLPDALLAAIDAVVRTGAARSRDAFIADAMRRTLATIENAEINAAFAAMAEDEVYQREAQCIAGEFERASWEALTLDPQARP